MAGGAEPTCVVGGRKQFLRPWLLLIIADASRGKVFPG